MVIDADTDGIIDRLIRTAELFRNLKRSQFLADPMVIVMDSAMVALARLFEPYASKGDPRCWIA